MPPSGHSSSHHSSSHHSSHSSSHHSSSRSYSSHSSHSSSHHSSSYTPVGNIYHSRTASPARRSRTSQPYGWNIATNGVIKHYFGASHDYDYYSQAWTASDGKEFEEGYYDEKGRHYDNVIMEGGTTMLKCSYCGNRMMYKWKEGALPVCDKCGAQLVIDITDKVEEKRKIGAGTSEVWRQTPGIGKAAVITFLLCLTLPFIVVGATLVMAFGRGNRNAERYAAESVKNSVYVDEIGRTCYRDGADWYDSETECWFYYNDDESPYQWQYWYEGISSDYGDYGWMEYDMGEGAWYIETDDGNWVHLPDSYDTSKLWHMTDEYTDSYN